MLKSLVIPNDLAACQSLLAELAKGFAAEPGAVENHLLTIKSHELTIKTHELTITSLNDRLEKLQQENAEQKLTISELLRRAFEKRSERYLEHPDQLRLDFGNTPEAADAAESLAEALAQAASAATEIVVPEHTRRQRLPRKPRNEQLPAHLPRHVVDAPVADEVKTCPTHGAKKLIGYDQQETLVFERPKLSVRVTRIPKYACEKSPECGVSEAARPEGLVEGNRYDTSVAAEIITSKFGLHLPIYRQQDLFAGSGWAPGRGTLLNIAEAAGDLLPPFIESLRHDVLANQANLKEYAENKRREALKTVLKCQLDEFKRGKVLTQKGYGIPANEIFKASKDREADLASRLLENVNGADPKCPKCSWTPSTIAPTADVTKLKSVVTAGLADRLQRFKDATIGAILKQAAEKDGRADLAKLMEIIQVATADSLAGVMTDELVEFLRKLLYDENLIQEEVSLGPIVQEVGAIEEDHIDEAVERFGKLLSKAVKAAKSKHGKAKRVRVFLRLQDQGEGSP